MVMAAIVGTLLYFPAGLAVVLVCNLVELPAVSLITFGGALGVFTGLLAWWLIGFAIVLPYAAFIFPWHAKMDGFELPGSSESR